MLEDQLTMFQKQQLKWLKQQVNNLKSLRYTRDAPPNLERDLFAAREELDDYVARLKEVYDVNKTGE
jgi:hypothetical protein